jgi:hypothetical protein
MPEPTSGILCGDGVESGFELRLQGLKTARGFGFEPLFHLGPGVLIGLSSGE